METGNSFYKWEVIENLGQFLTLKDLLSTATLSKQYNHILKKYIKQHYSLSNQQNHTQFQQLKSLFNRKLYTFTPKTSTHPKANPSTFIPRSIKSQQIYSIVQTLDNQSKLIKTISLLNGEVAELISLPQSYKFVGITQGGICYCGENYRITRYDMNKEGFGNAQMFQLKGEVQGMLCGNRFTVVVVRDQPENVRMLIFDSNEKLQNFKIIDLPFDINNFKIQDNLVMGKHFSYLLFHNILYEVNIKTGTVIEHPEFVGKKIVKIIAGRNHFMAYERTQELSENWKNQDVIKFAQEEGFQDFIKIFKAEKVTGKVLLNMDKKYMEEVLGIQNAKIQVKLKLRLQECNKQDPSNYVLHAWGRASQGQLATNPSKELTKPIKVKLPQDSEVLSLVSNYTFITNKKTNVTSVNTIDEKTNKLEWKQISNRKIWSVSAVGETIVLVASANKEKVPQRQSEQIVHQKKEKLRTAKNIIDKITWDEHLKPQEFTVGYLDKYDGILEVPFTELQKSQVKEYRIEYFKCGGQIMWDKKKRIDVL